MSSVRQDQKNERLLRELLKQPANKRCPNCDSIGPQYVVSGFNIFVCTVCSGVHRQFGHRVKGVSMSTFKKEEVEALQAAGNGLFAAHYLAKWTQAQLPKPTDRNPDRIREWIQAVYEAKRFFDGDKQYALPPAVLQSKSTSEGKEVLVRHLSDVLGVDKTPKLVVERTDSLERSPTAKAPSSVGGARSSLAGGAVNLLDISSPKAPVAAAPSPKAAAATAAATTAQEWDAFGAASAAAPTAAAQGAADGWAAFGDSPAAAVAAPPAEVAVSAPSLPQPVPASSNGTWEAFGDAAPSSIANGAPASPAPAKVEPQQQPQPKKEDRKEVPLDAFFPEFEQIRATGLLPNGQPAPVPVRPQQYGYAGMPQAYASVAPQAYGGATAAGYGFQAGVGPGVPPRPTVIIPAAPLYPTGVAPSPAGIYAPSPGAYGAPAYSPQGVISPTGSTGSGPVAYANGAPTYGRMDSLGSGTPTEPSPPAAQQHDPFATLAPCLKGALPNYGSSSVRHSPSPAAAAAAQQQYVAAPAGYAAAAPSPLPTPTTGSPFGSSSLFGGPPSLAAMPYDLTAPAAPKPKASGNPFA